VPLRSSPPRARRPGPSVAETWPPEHIDAVLDVLAEQVVTRPPAAWSLLSQAGTETGPDRAMVRQEARELAVTHGRYPLASFARRAICASIRTSADVPGRGALTDAVGAMVLVDLLSNPDYQVLLAPLTAAREAAASASGG
jgi:hypothetical protein